MPEKEKEHKRSYKKRKSNSTDCPTESKKANSSISSEPVTKSREGSAVRETHPNYFKIIPPPKTTPKKEDGTKKALPDLSEDSSDNEPGISF